MANPPRDIRVAPVLFESVDDSRRVGGPDDFQQWLRRKSLLEVVGASHAPAIVYALKQHGRDTNDFQQWLRRIKRYQCDSGAPGIFSLLFTRYRYYTSN